MISPSRFLDENASQEMSALMPQLLANKRIGEFCERAITIFYDEVLSPGDVVIDGGAAVGQHTIGMAVRIGDTGKVIGYEPLAKQYHERYSANLGTHLSGRKLDLIVDLREAAISDAAGTFKFVQVPDAPGYSGLKAINAPSVYERKEIDVSVVRLDDDIAETHHPKIKFIKLDLEGGEYAALDGGRNIIHAGQPCIAFEFSREKAAQLRAFSKDDFFALFEDLQYDLFTCYGAEFGPDHWDSSDLIGHEYFAVPKDFKTPLVTCGHRLVDLAKEML